MAAQCEKMGWVSFREKVEARVGGHESYNAQNYNLSATFLSQTLRF